MIYLDYNATTPVRPEVAREMSEHLAGPPGNPSSRHSFGRAAADARETARERVAAAADCDRESVVFTSGGTEASNLAIRGRLGTGAGRHLVTATTEHEATLQTADALAASGLEVSRIPVDGEGRVDPARVAAAIRPDTALVSLMAANNETGVLLDVAAVGEICRDAGVPFHTDAVQAFGKTAFPFGDLPVDLASVSSHKIGGPKGAGALLVRRGVEITPMVTGGGQERSLRPGTENLPGIVGFGKASEIARAELGRESRRLRGLRDRLEAGILAALPGTVVNGHREERLPNTSNLAFPGLDGEAFLVALDLEGVAVSTGAACNAGASDPSHVLLAMGRSRADASASLRFSLGWGSKESEIEEVIARIPAVAARLAGAGTTL